MKISKLVLLLFILLSAQSIQAQKTEFIDSLWNRYRTTTNDSIKLKAANYLAFHYIFRKPELSDSILNVERPYAKNKGLYFNLSELTNTRGIYFDVLGQKDSSKFYFEKALGYSRKYNYSSVEVMCINNLGMFCWNNGQFKEAIDYFYQALEYSQKHDPKNDKGQSVYLNNIGLIHQELGQYEKAIEYHMNALNIRLKYNQTKDIAGSYNNLAICHKSIDQLNRAENFIDSAITYAKEANQPKMVYQFHDNLGNILNLQKKYKEAEEAYLVALQVPEDYQNFVRDKFTSYSNLIDLYYTTSQFDKAKNAIAEAESLIQKDSTLYNFSESFYLNSAKTYYALQQTQNANRYLKIYEKVKDSLFSKENAKALADVEAKLKTKEKEAELAQTKSELLETELKVRQKNLLFYGSLSAIIILVIISYLVIKSKQLKNDQMKKEAELQAALSKIELKNQLEEQRLRISRDLHDNIGSQLTFVISGLQFIQHQKDIEIKEVKTRLEQLNQFTKHTINELRDTIWAMNKEEIQLTDLIGRLHKFINQTNIQENITLETPDDEKLKSDNLKFNAIEGIMVFRIIQEATNNAIKHAQAQAIKISIRVKDSMLNVMVQDDGKGFDDNFASPGNGLTNMQKRATQLKADLAVESKKDSGTTVSLTFQLTNQL